MALQGTLPVVRRLAEPRTARTGLSAERARSFARARRHTLLVRLLRVALPAVSLVAIASYGIGVRMSVRTPIGKLDTSGIAISTQNLTMSNPRYEGFNKDGSRFTVTAKTAVQDLKQQGPVALNDISGRLVQVNNAVVTLTAPRGQFDQKANQLELFDDIKIRGEDGMRADLKHAIVTMKENRIVSKQPVALDMAAGQVRANEMDLLQGAKQVTFSNGVATRLRPQPKPAATAAAAPAPGAATPSRLLGASDAPVDILSRTLRVDDIRKTAIFSGEVVAKQGEATLKAPELQAFYDGDQASAAGVPGQPMAGKLKRLFVPTDVTLEQGGDRVTSDSADFDSIQETATLIGRVVMNSGADRRATSDRADLDSHNDTALLSGNVVVNQDKNILRGTRLYVDRRAGITKLSSPAETGTTPGRIATRFFQASPAAGKQPAKKAEPAASTASGFVFRTDPNAPIDIDAETLDVVDRAKTATYRGAVHAVQGEFHIRTPELIAAYSGDAGLTTSADGKQGSAQLTRVRANQKVEVTSTDGQSATGDWADFDVKANTVTLGGHVIVKKGSSVVSTQKAIIDMTTGVTYFEKELKTSSPSVSASPTEQRSPYALPDLPAKKEPVAAPAPPAFASNPAACPPGRTCVTFDPKDGAGVQKGTGKGAATPWQTETAPAPKRKAPAAETSGWSSTRPSSN